jgi:3-methyladenine DNA glycosylase AlkD
MSAEKTNILDRLREEIRRHDKPKFRRNYQRFHREELAEPEGIRTDLLRGMSNRAYRTVRHLTMAEILEICESLLASDERYMQFFAFDWAEKLAGRYGRSDFTRFQRWLKLHVDSWSSCDHLCCGALGKVICQYPALVPRTRKWSKSRNRWLRRASAVSLIVSLRRSLDLSEGIKTADLLLADTDDMVQKGCGWMLKEASRRFPKKVFDYVVAHKHMMSRTTLRYAIEKLSAGQRKAAMRK